MGIPIGDVIWTTFKPMIKIYLIIGTGFGLSRINILSVDATRAISDIILTLLLPCLSFNKIVGNIKDSDIKDVAIVCLSSVIIFGTGLFAAFVASKISPVPKQWRGGILAGGMFPNISDIPIAYIQTLDQGLVFTQEEGDKGVASVIIFLAMFLLCLFNLGGFRLIEMDFKYKDQESANTEADNLDPTQKLSIPGETSSDLCLDEDSHSQILQPPDSATPIENISRSASHNPPPSITSNPTTVSSSSSSGYSNDSAHDRPLPYTSNPQTGSLIERYPSVSNSIRSIDKRDLPHEDVGDLIREYSNVDQYGNRRTSVARSIDAAALSRNPTKNQPSVERATSNLSRMLTSDATVSKADIEDSGKTFLPTWLQKMPFAKYIIFFIKNCMRPCSISVILALTISFIPWVKALFVREGVPHIHQAPDRQPALSFVMDYTSYVGAASVPFGLLLLGATLGRLKINKLYPGFWRTAILLVGFKLCIMPILGVLWCNRLVRAGWLHYHEDKMLLFVIALTWGLPSMTTIIYFTASYTPPGAQETVQMDCVSFFLMIQYPILVVSMPFLATFYLKVKLKE